MHPLEQAIELVNSKENLSTVFFCCEGREHLAKQTLKSFESQLSQCKTNFMIFDGAPDRDFLRSLPLDFTVANNVRRGYLLGILRAIELVKTPYFFWLEDDWAVSRDLQLHQLLGHLETNPTWAQIRLSKNEQLEHDATEIIDGLYDTTTCTGFSANPCLCNTSILRKAASYLLMQLPGSTCGIDGFENVFTRFLIESNYRSVVASPAMWPKVEHVGALESTDRKWHMTNTLDAEKLADINSYSTWPTPGLLQRLKRILGMWLRGAKVGVRSIYDRKMFGAIDKTDRYLSSCLSKGNHD